MQKEVFLAIFIGFIVGLLLTFGIWQANKAIKTSHLENGGQISEQTEEPTPEIKKPILTITSPIDYFLSSEPKISANGNYVPKSQVVILTEKEEKIIETDDSGSFQTEISLIAGENLIQFYGFTKDGDEAKQIVTVVYTTAEI